MYNDIELTPTPAMREYCHLLRFPGGWKYQRHDDKGQPLWFDHGRYEFRVEGLLSTRFLVGAYEDLNARYDAANIFRVDLSDIKGTIVPATRHEWDAATTVPLTRESVFPAYPQPRSGDPAKFHTLQFLKSGADWALSENSSRLSPDSGHLVLQSVSRVRESTLIASKARLFWDVFSAMSGKKLISFSGTYNASTEDIVGVAGGALSQTAWLTERYFIIPVGEHKERCLVCEFAKNSR